MADPRTPLTDAEIAEIREADFARAQARRDLKAHNSRLAIDRVDASFGQNDVEPPYIDLGGITSLGTRNLHILESLKPGEPICIFRAKDILSVMVLSHYAKLVEEYSLDMDLQADVVDKLVEFRAWQKANPEHVRLPD